MATHRTIASTETDPLAPIVAALMKALAANPVAIAEGATGAPKVMGQALGIYLGSQDPAANTYAGFTGLDRGTWVEIEGMMDSGATATGVQARLSSDNGSTWSVASTITGSNLNNTAFGRFRTIINLQTGAYRCYSSSGAGSTISFGSGTLALTGSPNAIQLRASGASSVIRFDAKLIGGLA
jgi:hypothetical protein